MSSGRKGKVGQGTDDLAVGRDLGVEREEKALQKGHGGRGAAGRKRRVLLTSQGKETRCSLHRQAFLVQLKK